MLDIASLYDPDVDYSKGCYIVRNGKLFVSKESGRFDIDDAIKWSSIGIMNPDLEPTITPLIFPTNCPNCGASYTGHRNCSYCGTYISGGTK